MTDTPAGGPAFPPDPILETRTPRRPPRAGMVFRRILTSWFRPPIPWTTYLLGAVIFAVHILMTGSGDPESNFHLLEWGSLAGYLLWLGESYRLLTCVFLHANWFHLGLNLLGLFLFGVRLEQKIGSWKIAFLFLLSGLGGSLAFVAVRPWENCVGASGALYGWVAVYVALRSGGWKRFDFGRSFWSMSLVLFLFDNVLAMALRLPVAAEAHWAGYATGGFAAWVMFGSVRFRKIQKGLSLALGGLALLLLVYVHLSVFNPGYHIYLADVTFVSEGPEAARGDYEEIRSRQELSGSWRLAVVEYESRGPEAALLYIDTLPEKIRDDRVFRRLRIFALDESGRGKEAGALLETHLDDTRRMTLSSPGDGAMNELLAANNCAMHRADHRRELDKALEDALRVVVENKVDEAQPVFLDTLGWVYVTKGEPGLGKIVLEKVWKDYPISEVAYHLAEACAALGEDDRARELLGYALDPRRFVPMGNLLDTVRARQLKKRLSGLD